MDIMRNRFTIGLAGLLIEIDTISPRTCIYCMDYLAEGTPNFKVTVSEKDIERELLESAGIKRSKAILENIAAYRKIAEKALDYDIVLLHGAVVATGNYAYMFSAPSGTGKTTHIKLWLQNDKDAYVVNGDKPLIKIEDNALIACGTPWSGSEKLNTNTMISLKAIVFVERNENNHIEKLSFSQAYPYLIQGTYIPNNAKQAMKTLALLQRFYKRTSFWRFFCNNFKEDCFKTSYDTLVQDL